MIGRVGQCREQQLLTLTPAVWGKTRGAVEDTGGVGFEDYALWTGKPLNKGSFREF